MNLKLVLSSLYIVLLEKKATIRNLPEIDKYFLAARNACRLVVAFRV